MYRQLTVKERERVRALMRKVPRLAGGFWLMPTTASVELERELTGVLQQSRERVAKMLKERNDEQAQA